MSNNTAIATTRQATCDERRTTARIFRARRSGRGLHWVMQPGLWFAAGSVLLAVHPLSWMWTTWTDPAYDSQGAWIAAAAAALLLWSASSPRLAPRSARPALALLLASAVVRLLGQLLAVNVVSALALVVDVFALAMLLGLDQRRRALSPLWLAVVFALSLPLERMAQRVVGYALQTVSAQGACSVLGVFHDHLSCHGTRIVLAGRDVLVDLPCSGARSLLTLLLALALLSALVRPDWRRAIAGLGLWLGAALLANVLRIVALALGIAFPDRFAHIDVMAAPWHDLIGLGALTLGMVPLLGWAARVPRPTLRVRPRHPRRAQSTPAALPLAIAFCAGAAVIVTLPASPVDVAQAARAPALPSNLLGRAARETHLSPQERNYFERYGGAASRSLYGADGLMLVHTSAPLRHLHTPDECLRGAGHTVRYLGMVHTPLPSAVYESVDPQGRAWRIHVSFVADDGSQVHSVAAAVWHWLRHPATAWTQIQRITPLASGPQHAAEFDRAVMHALETPR